MSIGVVPPPNTQTVKNTTSSAVVNIICLGWDSVSRIANANAIAPRKPEKTDKNDEINVMEKQNFTLFSPKPISRAMEIFRP